MQSAPSLNSTAPRSDTPEARIHAPWPARGFVTLKQILGTYGGPIPLSASRWWLGVKLREFPQPLKIGGCTVWRVSDINALIARSGQSSTE